MPTEQERAEAFRVEQLARKRNDETMERKLRGSSTAHRALLDTWDPIALALQEAREPGDNAC